MTLKPKKIYEMSNLEFKLFDTPNTKLAEYSVI